MTRVSERRRLGEKTSRGTGRTLRPVDAQILFLAPGDVGKGRVEPISWMHTCRAYAEHGIDVTLVTLKVTRPDAVRRRDVWEHYGIEPSFRIIAFPTLLRRNSSVAWFRFWAGLAAFLVAASALVRRAFRPKQLVVHTRLPILATPFVLLRRLLPSRRRPRIILETHSIPRRSHGWILRRVDLVIVNSDRLAADIRTGFGLPTERVLHAALPPYNRIRPRPRDEARRDLGLPADALIACYTGKLTEDHSEFLLCAAARLDRDEPRFRLLLVGGNPEILEWTRRRIDQLDLRDHVVLPGFVAPRKVELYQAAADVLVFYMPSSISIFPYCTPAKAYDYQAARRPIVATDIPLFEEVFGEDGERAIRVRERTPQALAEGIARAFALEDGGRAMTERAAAFVSGRTWERRAELLLDAVDLV